METETHKLIEKARLSLGLKPSEFARVAGFNRQHMSEIRSGRRGMSLKLALRLDALIGGDDFTRLYLGKVDP